MAPETAVVVLLIALVLGAVGLGGGVYETVLVDRAWPGHSSPLAMAGCVS
jgi:hypothetical protein